MDIERGGLWRHFFLFFFFCSVFLFVLGPLHSCWSRAHSFGAVEQILFFPFTCIYHLGAAFFFFLFFFPSSVRASSRVYSEFCWRAFTIFGLPICTFSFLFLPSSSSSSLRSAVLLLVRIQTYIQST
jgi:hypothetical protein